MEVEESHLEIAEKLGGSGQHPGPGGIEAGYAAI